MDILHEIIGEKVKHKLFGDGTIVKCSENNQLSVTNTNWLVMQKVA